MCGIVLPIYSKHANNIYQGTKKFEFRHNRPSSEIDYILLYETAPEKRITGLVKINDIIEGSPSDVWKVSKSYAGISKEYYDDYFSGRSNAIAYKIGKVCKFTNPLHIEDVNLSSSPQSFSYLDDHVVKEISSREDISL